jgi:NAD-dependent SIR2 family protein deacetylase
MDGLKKSGAVLVCGTSLMAYSGCRFCLAAAEAGIPVFAVNLGRTRADGLLTLKLNARCDVALPALADALI